MASATHRITTTLRRAALTLLLVALPATLTADAPYRPPDMKKELFDIEELKVDKFDRSGLVGSLVSIARDFDKEDEVDFELRAHALAIAGRIDPDNERVETCLEQLKKDGETVGEGADKSRVMRRLSSGLRALTRRKTNEANQVCAAYVADIALRLDPDGSSSSRIEKIRDELQQAGHEPDWSGLLGKAVRHAGSPWDQPEFVKAEVTMPGGKAEDFAQPQSRIHGLVVRQLPNGAHAGAASAVNATALPEEGQKGLLFTFNQDVGPMMGGCLEEVIKFLRVRYRSQPDKIPDGIKIELGFQDKYQLKDGPSAATVFTLLLDSLFTGEELDDDFAATGDMTADGMVQKIGGVAAKIRGATKRGCKIVGIPVDNATGVADLLVMDGPQQLLDIQVFTMKDFDQGHAISRKTKAPEVQQTLDAFQLIADTVREKGLDLLKNPEVHGRLEAVLEQMPNHLSAKLLLDFGQGNAPSQLSVGGTFHEIDIISSGVFRPVGMMLYRGKMDISDDIQKDAKESLEQLNKIAPQIDPRLKELHEATVALVQLVVDGRKDEETDEELTERLKDKMEDVQSVRRKLQEDPEIMEEIMG